MTEEIPIMQYIDTQVDGHPRLSTTRRYKAVKMSGYNTLNLTGAVKLWGATNTIVRVNIYEATGSDQTWHYLSTTFANNRIYVNSTVSPLLGMTISLPAGASTNQFIADTAQITNRKSVYYIVEAFTTTSTADFTLNLMGADFIPS